MTLSRTDLLVRIDAEKDEGLRDTDLVYVHGLLPGDDSGLDTFGMCGIDTGDAESARPRDVVCYVRFDTATVTVAGLEQALENFSWREDPPVLVYDEDTMQLIGVESCGRGTFSFTGEQYFALHVGVASTLFLLAS